MESIISRRIVIKYLILTLFYLGVTLIFTFPLITQLTTHIPGGEEDAPTHVWYLWWFKYAIFDQQINPIFTDYIFYPQIINRTFDIHTFINALLSTPFQYFFNLVTASNIVFLFSFVASSLGAYVLVNYLTKSSLASLVSGLIYGFFPYIFGQAKDNHTNLTTIWFIPFYMLFMLKAIQEKSYKSALIAGVFLGLQGMNDLTYTSFTLSLTALTLFYFLVFKKQDVLNLRMFKLMSVVGLTFVLISLPIMALAIWTVINGFKPGVPLLVQSVWSADIYYFLYPSAQNPLIGYYSKGPLVSSTEATHYLGYTTLLLSLGSMWLIKKAISRFMVGLWVFIASSFFILSLGPWLHFFGEVYKQVPLPFVVYHFLPLIGGIQEPLRFQPFTMLALSVLAGFTLSYLLGLLKQGVFKVFLTLIVILLVSFEYLPIPIPTTETKIPSVYAQIKEDQGDYSVLDLPVGWNTGNFLFGYGPIGTLQYYQTYHQKKIFRATVARLPAQNITFYQNIPLLKYLARPDVKPDADDLNQELVRKTFKDMKVKYILIHLKYYEHGKNRTLGQSRELIENVLGAKKFYESKGIIGYTLQ